MPATVVNFPTTAAGMPAGVDCVYWDTSFVIGAMAGQGGSPRLRHRAAWAFMGVLRAAHPKLMSVVSDLVVLEAFHVLLIRAISNEVKEFDRVNGTNFQRQKLAAFRRAQPVQFASYWTRFLPDALAFHSMVQSNFPTCIFPYTNDLAFNESLLKDSLGALQKYKIDTFDSHHASIAMKNGINCIATLDKDFEEIDSLCVLTCV